MAIETAIDQKIDYQDIEEITSNELVTELKRRVNQITSGPAASKFNNVVIELTKSYVTIVANFGNFLFLIFTYDRKRKDYSSRTITSGDYWLIKESMEGGK